MDKKELMQVIKSAKPADLAELEIVKDRFITFHNQITGTQNGELIYHKELFNYKKLIAENAQLRECSNLSLYGCFLDINVNGLSLEQGSQPDCYLIPKNIKVGQDENGRDIYEKRAQLSISPYGELKMRMRAGQIKYADNAIVVYDCDHFKVGLNDKGKLVVKEYDAVVPTPKDAKIVACFVRLERPDGSFEMPFLDEKAIERLKSYSKKQNRGTANALYGSDFQSIDTGFLKAKTLKHAFKSYPKVNTGQFAELEDDEPIVIDYGIDAEEASAKAPQMIDDFKETIEAHKNEEAEESVAFEMVDDDDEPNF